MTKTRAYTYVLPCIASTLKIDRDLIINLYLKKDDFFNEKYVFLEFKKNEDNLEYLIQQGQYEEHEDLENSILVKFKLNLIQAKINSIYINGKYSKFPSTHKQDILSYHGLGKSSQQYQILYRLPVLRNKLEQQLGVSIDRNSELGVKTNVIEETYIK